MSGVDQSTVTHKHAIDPLVKPIQYKRLYMSSEIREFVK